MILLGVWYNWLVPIGFVAIGFIVALALMGAAGLLLQTALPRVAAVARATSKECRSQPLFYAVLGLGFVLVLLSAFLPYNTLGDDIKVMKDTGLTMILLLTLFLAVSSASVSLADEVEGRTALTVLSKPIGRRQFIFGKLLGILTPVVLLYVVLGAYFLAVTSYKVKFEAREMSLPDPTWQQCQQEMLQSIPPLVLKFFETVVLTAISVAVSTRLGMIPNLLICTTVYLVGHMLPLVVQSSAGKLPIVAFMAQLLSTVLPVLEHFDVQAAVASGTDALLSTSQWINYLAWAGGYCVIYSTVMLLVALLLFEDRDLA